MLIEFGSEKERANLAVHHISLARAVDLTDVVEEIDDRIDYGEERIRAVGLIEGRVFVCIYTMRGDRRRIISLRRATGREADVYYSTCAGGP